MKQVKEKKTLIWIVAAAVILVALLCLGMGGGEVESTEPPVITTVPSEAAETEEETTAPAEEPKEQMEIIPCVDGEIETPYLTLRYPDALSDHLTVVNSEKDPYTLEFYALLEGKPEQRLFDVCLGENASGNLGTVETASGELPVGMTLYPFVPDENWTEGEINTVLAMQDAANYLVEQLPLVKKSAATETPVVSEVIPEANVVNYMSVKTPYCTLYYPVVWQDQVRVDQVEKETYRVRFYGRVDGKGEKLLFSVIFGGDEGEQVGVVTTDQDEKIPVYIVMENLILPGWSEEDAAEIYAMQEAVNQLLGQMPLE